ncbi:MAG: GDP-mannose 4,6-dehydratase [Coriobacteriia bacterium]
MVKRALITGIFGQDGTYLTEFLLARGYEVYGVLGPKPCDFWDWSRQHEAGLHLIEADLTDMDSILAALEAAAPAEVYNFAAQSAVGESWAGALAMTDVNAIGVLRLLEAVRIVAPDARLFQASSADMFGNATEVPQTEDTPMNPLSPYAVAKAYGYHIVRNYRESYGMHASNGIMFNHESPRRGIQFVSRKITDAVARIKFGLDTELRLGNLDAQRDWGFAGDHVEAMWLMLQQDRSGDYVVATGEVHSVREFCAAAFAVVDLDYRDYVKIDPAFLRPLDVNVLCGDSSKARTVLGWQPKVGFTELVRMMVDADLDRVRAQSTQESASV